MGVFAVPLDLPVSLHSSRSADFMGVFTVVDFKECITVCIPITRLPCGFVMFLQAWSFSDDLCSLYPGS